MNKKGFTLVETLIALAIMAILSLIVVPNVIIVIDKNKEKSCNNLIKNIESAAKIYVNNNKYDLNFTCGGTIEIKFQTLVDSGDLKLEDDDKLTNPANNTEIELDNTVSVTYNCDTNEFLYAVNGINCTDSEDDCEGLATMPTIENKIYTGSEQTGVTGGTNVNIIGDKSATNLGNYTVTIVPNGKACWNDGTRARIERTWKIDENRPSIMLNEKTAEWTGSPILIDNAVVTGTDGARLNDIPVIYTYFNGNSCALANQISGEPIEVGSYSVKASTNSYNNYNANESSCTKLTITKATATLTTSTSSISPTYPNNGTFTYTYNGDGALSCSSSNTTIATCSLNASTRTVTVTPKKKGSVTITVSAGEGAHYKATSKTVSVNVKGQANPLTVSAISGLVYNKNAQTLVTASNAQGTVYYSTSTSLTSSNYSSKGSTTKSTGTNAGSYTVYYYTPGNNYYAAKSGSVSVTISKASCSCSISNVSTLGYPNTTSGTVTYNCTGDGTKKVTSSNTNILTVGTIETTSANLTAKKDGNSTLTVSQGAGSNYNACSSATKSVTVNIDILDNPLTVSARNLTYTGSAQNLVTSNNDNYGTIYYSTSTKLTSSNYSSKGSTNIPSGINAGPYTVYYYTPGTSYYYPTSGTVSVSIAKASCICTISSVTTLGYPVNTSGSVTYSCTGDGTKKVTSSNTNILTVGTIETTSANLTAKKDGNSTLTVGQEAGSNYNACTSDTESVTVGVDVSPNTLSVTAKSLTYTGSAQELVSASNAQGTVYYSTITQLTSSNYTSGSKSIPKGTDAGPYTVYYYTPGTTYYASKSGSVNVNIAKASCSCSFSSVDTLSYPGTTSGNAYYSCNGDGIRSLTSSNTSVVSLGTVGSKSTSLTGLKTGSSTLTLSQAAGTNYNACSSATHDITVSTTTYTISYNGNGSTVTNIPSAQTKTYGVDLTLRDSTPSRSGYEFLGWSTDSNATSPSYYAGSNFTVNANTTLYAVWESRLVLYSYGWDNTAVTGGWSLGTPGFEGTWYQIQGGGSGYNYISLYSEYLSNEWFARGTLMTNNKINLAPYSTLELTYKTSHTGNSKIYNGCSGFLGVFGDRTLIGVGKSSSLYESTSNYMYTEKIDVSYSNGYAYVGVGITEGQANSSQTIYIYEMILY